MFIGHVCLDAAKSVAVVELDTDVIVERTDWGLVADQDFLGFAESSEALLAVEFAGGVANELIVTFAAPAGAIVAPVGDEHIHERVGVRVIANPRRTAEVVVERGERCEIDLPLLLLELNGHAQFASE